LVFLKTTHTLAYVLHVQKTNTKAKTENRAIARVVVVKRIPSIRTYTVTVYITVRFM
jgi:hypothetical protein